MHGLPIVTQHFYRSHSSSENSHSCDAGIHFVRKKTTTYNLFRIPMNDVVDIAYRCFAVDLFTIEPS